MQTALEDLPETRTRPGVSAEAPWFLDKGDFYSRRLALGESIHIYVLDGECWITLEGDPADHVISTGMSITLHGPGVILMESLQPHSYGTIWQAMIEQSSHH